MLTARLGQLTTVRQLARQGHGMPRADLERGFIAPADVPKIEARLALYTGPGWYSYDGSMYRRGQFATFSRIALA